MSNQPLIQMIHLQNFLSFTDETIKLGNLNVLIGANGSGKSNLLEAFRLLRATPRDFTAPIGIGGGVREWINKSAKQPAAAKITTVVSYPQGVMPLRYAIEFTSVQQRVEVTDEYVENELPIGGEKEVYFFYRFLGGKPVINANLEQSSSQKHYAGYRERRLRQEDLNLNQSVLSQRTDKDTYPEITYLGQQLGNLRIYSDWNVSHNGILRQPQRADGRSDFLEEDASNHALIVNDLLFRGQRAKLLKDIQQIYERFTDVITKIEGGTIQLFLQEDGAFSIPTARLADGILRFLALIAILRHPTPPALICIEEPEIGIHPDLMAVIAELLIEAAQRTQIIVTTHSDALISSLPSPSMVYICERDETGSHIRQFDPGQFNTMARQLYLGRFTADE